MDPQSNPNLNRDQAPTTNTNLPSNLNSPDISPDSSKITLFVILAILIIVGAVIMAFFLVGDDSEPIPKQEGSCSEVGFELLNCSYVLDNLQYETTMKFKRISDIPIEKVITFINFESRPPKFEEIESIPSLNAEGENLMILNFEPSNFYLLVSFTSQSKNCKTTEISCLEIIPAITTNITSNVTGTGNNTLPVADAGSNQHIGEDVLVVLNGSDSYDVDGDSLTYSWTQISGINVTLSDENSVAINFTTPFVDEEERLVFELTVSDGIDTDTDEIRVYIEVEEVEGSISAPPSLPPSLI